jgi:hypothetical protein
VSLLSKWIHGDHPWRMILHNVLTASRPRSLPAGKAAGQYFFCALLAGVPACFANIREDLRGGRIGRALEDAGAAIDIVGQLRLRSHEAAMSNRHEATNIVGAFVGPLSKSGRMEVAALSLPSLFSAIDFAWQTFRSSWRDLAGVAPHPAENLFIEADGGQTIPVILDGESVSLGTSFAIQFVEKAARCLVAG